LYKLFGCPFVLDSKYCAVIQTPDNGYAFGVFRYPRRTFEQVATYTYMADAKRAFDAYNQAMRHWRKAADRSDTCGSGRRWRSRLFPAWLREGARYERDGQSGLATGRQQRRERLRDRAARNAGGAPCLKLMARDAEPETKISVRRRPGNLMSINAHSAQERRFRGR
jgi:hypothetical protein